MFYERGAMLCSPPTRSGCASCSTPSRTSIIIINGAKLKDFIAEQRETEGETRHGWIVLQTDTLNQVDAILFSRSSSDPVPVVV